MSRDDINLGELIAIHRGLPIGRRDTWWLAGLVICITIPLLLGILSIRSFAIDHGLYAAIFQVQYLFLIAYLAFLFFITILVYRLWTSKYFVAVYDKGIRWRLKGFRTKMLVWEELNGIATAAFEDVLFNKKISDEQVSILYPARDRPILLDRRLQGLDALIEEIKNQYYPVIFPHLMENFKNGQIVSFGPVVVQDQSISLARTDIQKEFLQSPYQSKRMQTFPWSTLSGLSVKSGFLMVKSENSKIKRIPVSHIPNFEILLKIVEQGVNS
jgi:hypothetical protein